jgi:hypothetical protein
LLLALEPGNVDALYGLSRHCWLFTLDHRKAMHLLRLGRRAEQEETGNTTRYQWYLEFYKDNYRKEIAVDWSRPKRLWNYIWIFWLS